MGLAIKKDIFNYSFARIDLANYSNNFNSTRKKRIKTVFHKDINVLKVNINNYEQILDNIRVIYSGDLTCEPVLSNDWETFSFLKWILLQYINTNHISDIHNSIINKLQKKFEVFHRIYDVYNKEVLKVSNIYNRLEIYALLSLFLNVRFIKRNNFNDFNTVLKLNDLLLFSSWQINKANSDLILNCLLFENIIEHKLRAL